MEQRRHAVRLLPMAAPSPFASLDAQHAAYNAGGLVGCDHSTE